MQWREVWAAWWEVWEQLTPEQKEKNAVLAGRVESYLVSSRDALVGIGKVALEHKEMHGWGLVHALCSVVVGEDVPPRRT